MKSKVDTLRTAAIDPAAQLKNQKPGNQLTATRNHPCRQGL
jgi:hypothetical protein